MPRAPDCALAAETNSSVTITTVGLPFISNQTESCKLHVIQEPQSARPTMTASHSSNIF